MLVRDAMSTDVLTVGPAHTLRAAARLMSSRRVGSAVVVDPDGAQPGIVSERDVLDAVAAGADLDTETVGEHLATQLVVVHPDWSLVQATAAMVAGRARHMVVCADADVVGVLSMRDIVVAMHEAGVPVPSAV